MKDQRRPASRAQLTSNTFALEPQSTTGACDHCNGSQRIAVLTNAGVIGYLVSGPQWSDDIPDDPAQHPRTPHYVVEWHAENAQGVVIEREVTSLYFTAVQMFSRHVAGHSDRSGEAGRLTSTATNIPEEDLLPDGSPLAEQQVAA